MFPGRGSQKPRRVHLSWKRKKIKSPINPQQYDIILQVRKSVIESVLNFRSVHTGRGYRPVGASAAAITVEEGGFVGVDSLTVHLV